MGLGIIVEKIIYIGILVAVFVVFKRASNQILKSVYWTIAAGVTLYLSILFAGFTSTNGQLFLKRAVGIAPSEASETSFGILSIITPILWLIFFIISLKKQNRTDLGNT